MSVVLFHVVRHFFEKSGNAVPAVNNTADHIIHAITQNFNRGVELFFSISGFILALPFASAYLKGSAKPVLKNYFIRRLTRLEPPYLISLTLFFILNYVTHHNPLEELVPHYIASFFYLHNFIYAPALPLINGITWSLEIEIQFYILAPLLTRIFMISNKQNRRLLLSTLVVIFILFNQLVHLPFVSILNYFQYFFVGFLIADLYLEADAGFINTNRFVEFIAGCMALYFLFFFPNETLVTKFILPAAIFYFFFLCMFSRFWKRLANVKLLTVIGGMCYSIYLLHLYIAALADRINFSQYIHAGIYSKLVIHTIISCIIIILVSGIYFLLVEKPCMDKDWVKKLVKKIRRK